MSSTIETKSRPIIFSGEMVRAILAGRKTQTRRVVHEKHVASIENLMQAFTSGHWEDRPLPYGCLGDRLWVREAHYFTFVRGHERHGEVLYAADHPGQERPAIGMGRPWRSPIHMPRWASRITLEISGIRVERLHEIDEWGARAEGLRRSEDTPNICGEYRRLWESINGDGSWKANPWVWVISFNRVQED